MKKGFGFFDASAYEPQPDNTAWIIKNLLPKGFGFVAGPPKGNSSPHGGKSVFERKLALSIITGDPFLGFEVIERGRVMFMNLDEGPDKQVRLYWRMTKGKAVPGYLISQAVSCRLPEQIPMLENDVIEARPLVLIIDPFLRTLGTKAVKNQEDVGPILNELKRIGHTYDMTVIVNHHSNKSAEREKESTSSWLSGSVDLDSAWDFCLGIEWHKEWNVMHVRNFQKEKAKTDFYYEADVINGDEIVDLIEVFDQMKESEQARKLYKTIIKTGETRPQWLSKILGIAESSIRYQIGKFAVLKAMTSVEPHHVENK